MGMEVGVRDAVLERSRTTDSGLPRRLYTNDGERNEAA